MSHHTWVRHQTISRSEDGTASLRLVGIYRRRASSVWKFGSRSEGRELAGCRCRQDSPRIMT